MKYNGMEVYEVEGRDYHLGMTPKKMLVWDNGQCTLFERDVLGFFNGFWVAADDCGKGVCQWLHAAEIPTPTPTVRPFTSAEELDKAIAKHGPWVLGLHSGARYLITSYGNSSVRLDGDSYTMESMMKEFTFLDGTPCGVVQG